MLDKLEQEVEKAGMQVPANRQAEFQSGNSREFSQVISARSDVMVANMFKVAAANPGAPLAMTDWAKIIPTRLVELFTKAGISIAHIRPWALTGRKNSAAGLALGGCRSSGRTRGSPLRPPDYLGALLEGRGNRRRLRMSARSATSAC